MSTNQGERSTRRDYGEGRFSSQRRYQRDNGNQGEQQPRRQYREYRENRENKENQNEQPQRQCE